MKHVYLGILFVMNCFWVWSLQLWWEIEGGEGRTGGRVGGRAGGWAVSHMREMPMKNVINNQGWRLCFFIHFFPQCDRLTVALLLFTFRLSVHMDWLTLYPDPVSINNIIACNSNGILQGLSGEHPEEPGLPALREGNLCALINGLIHIHLNLKTVKSYLCMWIFFPLKMMP